MFEQFSEFSSYFGLNRSLVWISIAILMIGFLQNVIYAWCLPQAWFELKKRSQKDEDHASWTTLRAQSTLPISVILPAYNEANTIRESVMALLALEYPDLRIIVVNDGSSDDTVQVMIDEFKMREAYCVRDCETILHKPIRQIYQSDISPSLTFLDKENGKKADAINAGLTCVRTPLFCVIDADSLLEPKALLQAVRPFMEASDNVIAVGGTIGVVNGCTVKNGQVVEYKLPKSFLARLQVVEYMRAFLMGRLAASRKGSLAIISGAFGIFRRDVAVAVGGYDTLTVGEDMDLVLKMHKYMMDQKKPYAVRYVPEPVCWTEVPEDFKTLSNQRTRWQRGSLECLDRHKDMIFNPRYGRLGMVTLPTFLLVDLISPLAEILGYILMALFVLLGWIDVKYFIAITSLIFSYGVLISILSLILEQEGMGRLSRLRDLSSIFLTAVIENFGYRQICTLCRFRGLYQYFRNETHTWGTMERKGFSIASL